MIRLLLLATLLFSQRFVLCGRFNLTRPKDVVERFGFMDWSDKRPEPRFNIAPSQEILTVIGLADGTRSGQLARWGFAPFWSETGAGTGLAGRGPPSGGPPPVVRGSDGIAPNGPWQKAVDLETPRPRGHEQL